jgi:hypothetical protein
VNANGNITFGTPDGSPFQSIPAFLAGPPRIAALWTDLNPSAGGKVSYNSSGKTFTVTYANVPEFPNVGAVNLEIALQANNQSDIRYGTMTAQTGIAGLSGGALVTSQFETPQDLSTLANSRTINLMKQPALFEQFTPARPNDLVGKNAAPDRHDLTFVTAWSEPNNAFGKARSVSLPFDSKNVSRLTEIQPAGADVDFFTFKLNAGDLFLARVLSGGFDSLLGLFKLSGAGSKTTGTLVALDDDSGPGTLSRIIYTPVETGTYALAATCFPGLRFQWQRMERRALCVGAPNA